MNILIPLDKKDFDEGKIAPINEAKTFIVIEFDEGEIKGYKFFDDYNEIIDEIDVAIFINHSEYVWPFIERNIVTLVAPIQKYIEDIIEAFMFKELHDFTV